MNLWVYNMDFGVWDITVIQFYLTASLTHKTERFKAFFQPVLIVTNFLFVTFLSPRIM